MNAKSSKSSGIPFNGNMLRWARLWRGRTLEDVAKKLNKSASQVEEWEAGNGVPTVRQARILADFYERPFLEFFWKETPPLQPLNPLPDFRLYVNTPDVAQKRELLHIQSWIETQRLNALDLFETLGEAPPEIPVAVQSTIREPAAIAAQRIRDALEFPIEQQLGLASNERDGLPKIMRKKMELVGILTLKATQLSKYGARGIAVTTLPLPVVAFGAEAPAAQAFTLAHELGHIALRQSAISGPIPREGGQPEARRIEEWCNDFAGAFLVPERSLAALWERPTTPRNDIDEDTLRKLANAFAISRHAMIIRLVKLSYVAATFYWEVMYPKLREEERNYRGGGRPKYYGTRYVAAHGDLYTHLVLEAWSSGQITNHNAAEFMDIENLQHLSDIREHFGT